MSKSTTFEMPFQNSWKDFMGMNNYGDFSSVPSVDFNNIVDLHRKNLEAFNSASQVLSENFQNITKKQIEFIQAQIEKNIEVARELLTAEDPQSTQKKQMQIFKEVITSATNNARDFYESSNKSNVKAMDYVSKRMVEFIEEINQDLFSNTNSSATASKKAA